MDEAQIATKSHKKQRSAAAKSRKTDLVAQAHIDLMQSKVEHTQISNLIGKSIPNAHQGSSALWRTSIQAKLKVGKPNDPYEQEADAVADKVVQALFEQETSVQKEGSPSPQTQAHVEPEVQAKGAWSAGSVEMFFISRLRDLNILEAMKNAGENGMRYACMGKAPLHFIKRSGQMQSDWHAYDMVDTDIKKLKTRNQKLKSIAE